MTTIESEPIEQLVTNILETRYENIEPSTIEQAKLRIIDVVGCLLGGCMDPGNSALVDLLTNQGGQPEASILVYGAKVPVANAAMANCILCRSFDFEPVSPVVDGQLTPAHISGTTVMTALALAEFKGLSGREMITAMLAGEDLTARVLATSGFSINLGWDGNGTGNALGATAIAGRILGLTPRQLRHALGLVISQMSGSMQNIWDATPAFKLPQGLSARNGIFSAQLAAAGWTGPDDALLSANGYYKLFTNGITHGNRLTKDLGKVYYSDRAIKPYPSCRATHGAIACALAMVDKYGLKPGDIEQVHLCMPHRDLNNFCGKPFETGPFPHAAAAFSYQYTVATAFLFHSVKPKHFTSEAINAPSTRAFMQKIKLEPKSGIDTPGAEIKVMLKDGRVLLGSGMEPAGDFIDNPLSKEAFFSKFHDNVKYSNKIDDSGAEKIVSFIQHIEKHETMDELIGLLIGS